MKLSLHRQSNRKERKRKEFLGRNGLRRNICGGNFLIPIVMGAEELKSGGDGSRREKGTGDAVSVGVRILHPIRDDATILSPTRSGSPRYRTGYSID